MNSKDIRKLNTARVFHAIRQRRGISQARLQTLTGLDRSTVSAVLQQLEIDGIVSRLRTADRSAMGRPTDSFSIVHEAGHLVGVSIETNRIVFAASGLDGEVRVKAASRQRGDRSALQFDIVTGYFDLVNSQGISPTSVRGVGISMSSEEWSSQSLHTEGGRTSALLLAEDIEAQIGSAILIGEETAALAWAEHMMGAARGIDSFLFVDGRSGIRGALCLDGAIRFGDYPTFSGLGHVKVEMGGRTCICGQQGCLQAYVSEQAILTRLAEFKRPARSLSEVASQARSNDALARTVLTEAGSYLGIALANALNLLGLREVVLAGHLGQLDEFLAPGLRQVFKAALWGDLGDTIKLRRSQVGPDAVVAGPIALAMQSFLPGPTYWQAKYPWVSGT